MSIYRVSDVPFENIGAQVYDAALIASGYEDRCTYLSEHINPQLVRHAVIFGFVDLANSDERAEHDKYLAGRWDSAIMPISAEDDGPVYDMLRNVAFGERQSLRILVDYSSMSRLWYAALLNWARYGSGPQEVILDFVYSIGEYEKDAVPMVIQDMLAIPGCEGGALRLDKSVAVFGLGFNGWASLCVLERLEADVVYAFMASPASVDGYPEKVLELNKDFLEEPRTHQQVLEFPLRSVETSYRYLSELITPHRANDVITLVPMGPKPQVLAAMLVSMRFPEVSCLRISAKRERQEKVAPIGEVVATRVIVRR